MPDGSSCLCLNFKTSSVESATRDLEKCQERNTEFFFVNSFEQFFSFPVNFKHCREDSKRCRDDNGESAQSTMKSHVLCRFRSLLFLPPLCIVLAERSCSHCNSSKKTGANKLKFQSRHHNSTNSKHTWAESSVINLNICYGESVYSSLIHDHDHESGS